MLRVLYISSDDYFLEPPTDDLQRFKNITCHQDMRKAFIVILCFVYLISCRKQADKNIPECINKNVFSFKMNVCTRGASVNEYTFMGQKVYAFDQGNCIADGQTEITDSNCVTLGYLGGLLGSTKINGMEFSTAVYVKTIWKN